MATDREPRTAPPPGPGARYDAFERETLRSLNQSLRGVLRLSSEGNRLLGKLADVLGLHHETAIAARDLAQIAITEQQLTREALRVLTDEISLWRAERRAERERDAKPERTETTAVRSRPVRKVAG